MEGEGVGIGVTIYLPTYEHKTTENTSEKRMKRRQREQAEGPVSSCF